MLINTGNISRKVLSKVLRSFDKNFERLQWEMPIRKITFIDWLDSEENLKWLNQCYVALWQVLFLRGEYDEIQRTIADLYYACEKFEELGIPVPFKKFI